MCNVPEQLPGVVKLLAESHSDTQQNPENIWLQTYQRAAQIAHIVIYST